MTRKRLVLWDYDLGLVESGFNMTALKAVTLYRKIAAATKRILVLCITTETQISMRITALFDQVFLVNPSYVCIKNRHGSPGDAIMPNAWWNSGWRNSVRYFVLTMMFASDQDRNRKLTL